MEQLCKGAILSQNHHIITVNILVFLFLITGSAHPGVAAVGLAYTHPTPVLTNTLSAETVEGNTL